MFKFSRSYHVALVAPASFCPEETVLAGKQILEKCGCRVTLMPHLFQRGTVSHLSASDADRAADINSAVADDDIDLIWAVRGGSGALRILEQINWPMLREKRKMIAGFSDITAIHWAMARFGCDGILAAPTISLLADAGDEVTLNTLPAAVEGKECVLHLPAIRGGEISGFPLPGNIAVAASLCGTAYFPDTTGKIIVLEEVGEAAYRLDRMLTQLLLSGTFDRCAGVVFAHFTRCGENSEVMDILHDFTRKVHCPVFFGFPHGHELPFYSLSSRQYLTVS